MDKNEILNKARQENKGKDFADVEAQRAATWIGYWVLIGLMIIADVINGIVLHYVNRSGDFVLFTVAAVVFFIKYIRLRKKHELIVAAIFGILSLAMLAVWIMQLCKVI